MLSKQKTDQLDYNVINNADFNCRDRISSKGSCNPVHKAIWTSPDGSQSLVAAKFCNQFKEEEVKILAGLQHKNIITFCGIVKLELPPDSYVIVTEYAEKGSLYDVIAQNRENWSEYKQRVWMKWALEGAEALKFIHQNGYQHGDVKSPNFVITSDDIMKICDFGTARPHVYTLTTYSIRGSWPWMAPEAMGIPYNQERHPKVTAKADVFSFAVVLWELITGQEPFPGLCQLEIYKTVAEKKEQLEIPKHCPKRLSNLLKKCWAPEYQQRPNMEEVLECLVKQERYMDKPDLNDEFFLRLSKEISTKWAELAILLKFARAEVDAYKANNMGDVLMQCHTMLVDWRNKQENMEEARQVLSTALLKTGRNDLAQQIQGDETHNEGSRENQNLSQEKKQRSALKDVQNDAAAPVDYGYRVLIKEICQSSQCSRMRRWHLKAWMADLDAPRPAENGSFYFQGELRDESRVSIPFIYFEKTLERCETKHQMVAHSTEERPLCMWHVTVRGYQLKFNKYSRIRWA